MNQWLVWLAMGGYSGYVWSAYGVVFVVFLINYSTMKRKKNLTNIKLRQWFER